MFRAFMCSFLILFVSASSIAEAKDKKGYHCEIKKKGKTIDDPDIESRKVCKKKGGKWVKDHGADHSHGEGEDHEHEEE